MWRAAAYPQGKRDHRNGCGKILLEEIEVILSHVNNLQRLITTDTLNRNFIRIGLSTFSSGAVFPQICAEYHKQYPKYRLISYENSTPDLFSQLDAGRLDLIITSPGSYKRRNELLESYYIHDLALSGLRYCVAMDHPGALREFVTLEEMAAEPLILLSGKYPSAESILQMFTDHGLEPNIIMRTSQMYTIERFVECGAAAGFLPNEITDYNGGIAALNYPEDRPQRHVAMIWKKDSAIFPAIDKFISTAKEVFPGCKP